MSLADLPPNLMWTHADLERMTPQQISRLTRAGELKHLLDGSGELDQATADALKELHHGVPEESSD